MTDSYAVSCKPWPSWQRPLRRPQAALRRALALLPKSPDPHSRDASIRECRVSDDQSPEQSLAFAITSQPDTDRN